jgi:uncharacterized protein YhjY with autotransporter beta-barrel domain
MKNIVQDYQNLKGNLGFLIQKSGFKNSYLAEKIGMQVTNFSVKKQKGNWSDTEIEKLLDIIDNEELEDLYLGKLMEQRSNDETISLEQFKNEMGWK